MILVVILFRIFGDKYIFIVFAICELVHDVETMFHISYVLKAFGNLF